MSFSERQCMCLVQLPHRVYRKNLVSGAPGWLSWLSVWLRLRLWSCGPWVPAWARALCWQLRVWSLLWILCLPLSLLLPSSCSVLSVSQKWVNVKTKFKKKFGFSLPCLTPVSQFQSPGGVQCTSFLGILLYTPTPPNAYIYTQAHTHVYTHTQSCTHAHTAGKIIKISCQPRKPLHEDRRERKQFCYWISIEPDCMHHG